MNELELRKSGEIFFEKIIKRIRGRVGVCHGWRFTGVCSEGGKAGELSTGATWFFYPTCLDKCSRSKASSLCALFLPSTIYAVLPRLHIREQSEPDPLDVNISRLSIVPKSSVYVMGSILICPTSRRPSFLIPDLVKGNTSDTIF
jgi:hypothetical protein